MNQFKLLKKTGLLLLILMLALIGLTACGEKQEEAPETRLVTVRIKDDEGAGIDGTTVAFYDSSDKELLSDTTKYTGKIEFPNCPAGVVNVKITAVPGGYRTDLDAVYTIDETNELTVVLNRDLSDSSLETYEATIDGRKYATFTDAIADANGASEDTTIVLASDITIGELTVNNLKGHTLCVDGNGYTITTKGGNNAFRIYQESGTVEFKNFKVIHTNTGGVFRTYHPLTLNVTNVQIDATQGEEYFYCLFNVFGPGGESWLNLTGVDVTMAVETAGKDNKSGVIRTGNDGSDQKKTVHITMKDCNIDSSGAAGRPAVMIMDSTEAKISIADSSIKTKDTYAIRANWQPVELSNVTLDSESEIYQNEPIEDRSNVISDDPAQAYAGAYTAKIGDKEYYSVATAIYDANVAQTDTVITMIGDSVVKEVQIKNIHGKNITIDGGGHTITTKGGNNALRVYQEEGWVEFKNLTIDHRNTGSAVQIYRDITVKLTDVTIDATQGEAYNYALINLYSDGGTSKLELTNVNVTMQIGVKGKDSRPAVVRTGNSDQNKAVLITLKNCQFDLTQATGRTGIMIMQGTTAYVTMENSVIRTKDIYPIRDNNQTFVLTDCEVDSLMNYYTENPFEKGDNVDR